MTIHVACLREAQLDKYKLETAMEYLPRKENIYRDVFRDIYIPRKSSDTDLLSKILKGISFFPEQ